MEPFSPNLASLRRALNFAALGWLAHIHMLVPLRHAERNSLVELLLTEAHRRGVHGADQLVVVSVLFIQQRCWLGGIKAKSFANGVLIIGEVVHLLRDVGQEDPEAFIQRDFVVTIFFQRRPRLLHHLLRFGCVARVGWPQFSHVHVGSHVLVLFMVVAVPHGFSGGIQLALAGGRLLIWP